MRATDGVMLATVCRRSPGINFTQLWTKNMPDNLASIERCPSCGAGDCVQPKLVLIDEAWLDEPGKDPRLKYFADLRVDDVKAECLRDSPLQQFVDGFYCSSCGHGFVSEESLVVTRRRYK
jgi:hypothetical protein